MKNKKYLYLFRHGETNWNKLGIIQGISDIPLNFTGIEQAKQLGQFFLNKKLDIIYSSHLKRAKQTGDIIAKKLNIKIIKDKDLREVSFGKAEGKKIDEIYAKLGLNFKKRWLSCNSNDDEIKFPEGESKFEIKQRMLKTISKISLESPYNIIGFSSHGFVIKQLVIACGNNKNKGFKNCEIAYIEFDISKYDEKNLSRAFKFIKKINIKEIYNKKSLLKNIIKI